MVDYRHGKTTACYGTPPTSAILRCENIDPIPFVEGGPLSAGEIEKIRQQAQREIERFYGVPRHLLRVCRHDR